MELKHVTIIQFENCYISLLSLSLHIELREQLFGKPNENLNDNSYR